MDFSASYAVYAVLVSLKSAMNKVADPSLTMAASSTTSLCAGGVR